MPKQPRLKELIENAFRSIQFEISDKLYNQHSKVIIIHQFFFLSFFFQFQNINVLCSQRKISKLTRIRLQLILHNHREVGNCVRLIVVHNKVFYQDLFHVLLSAQSPIRRINLSVENPINNPFTV